MRITVVGGEVKFVTQKFMSVVLAAGHELLAHVDLTQAVNIPTGTEAVLFLSDCYSDLNRRGLEEAVERVGAKLIRVSRRWAKAEPILRAAGILPASTQGAQPLYGTKAALAVQYIKDQHHAGREPSRDEVIGILRANLGPKTKVTRKSLELWFQEARSTPVTPTISEKTIREAARAVIEARPAYTKPQLSATLVTAVKELARPTTVLQGFLWPDSLWGVVEAEAEAARGTWGQDVAARHAASRIWASQLWEDFLEGGAFPGSSLIKKEGVAVFGRHVHHDIVKQARAKVLGEWALEVQPSNQLADYFKSECESKGVPHTDIKGALKCGTLLGYEAARRWWTSKEAVDLYIAEWSKPPKEEPQKTEAISTSTGPFALIPRAPDPEEERLLAELGGGGTAEPIPDGLDAFLETIDIPVDDGVEGGHFAGVGVGYEMPNLDLNAAFQEALGEIIETKLIDLSETMADLIGTQVSTQQGADFVSLRGDLFATLNKSLFTIGEALTSKVAKVLHGHTTEMARIHTGSSVIHSVSEAARQVRTSEANIRTWLGNISRSMKALDPAELSPEALASVLEHRLGGIEASIKAAAKAPQGRTQTRPEASEPLVQRLKAIEAALSALLRGQADLMEAPKVSTYANAQKDTQAIRLGVNTLADTVAQVRRDVQALAPAEATPTGATLADLVKLAASQGLKVSFEPL
jgi:hypothetical protein